MSEEAALIERALGGDEAARDSLAQAHYRRLYATACHFLGPGDPEVQDCVQEAMMRGFKGLQGFQGKSSFYTWLNQICVNACFDRLEKRRRRLEDQTEDLEAFSGPASRAALGREQEQAVDAQRLQLLRKALQDLPEPCQSLVRRHHFEGIPCATLARDAKVPLGTMLARLFRCRERLKRSISEEGRP